MSKHNDINTSYGLEHRLAQSIEKVRDNVTRSHALKKQIINLRRNRRQVQAIPEEVKQWFEDTEGLDEDEEQNP